MAVDVAQQAKHIVVDNDMARCILVLSDATLVFALHSDDAKRRTLLYVDSFTVDEANQFLDRQQSPWNASFRSQFFEKIGTRPSSFPHAAALRTQAQLDDYVAEDNSIACGLMSVWVNDLSTHTLLHRIALANGAPVTLEEGNVLDILPNDLLRMIKSKGHLLIYDGKFVIAHAPPKLRAIQCWHLKQTCRNPESNCTM
jgi:hypothetical protein